MDNDAMVERVARAIDGAPFEPLAQASAALQASHHAELVEALILIGDNAKIGLQVQDECVDEHDAFNEARSTLHQIAADVSVILAKIGA